MKKYISFLLFIFALLSNQVFAEALAQPKILPIEQVFIFTLNAGETALQAHWDIAPGYALYQEHLHLTVVDDKGKTLLSVPTSALPKSQEDGYYTQSLTVPIELAKVLQKSKDATWALQVDYQGCAQSGFCYPPVSKHFEITVKAHHITHTDILEAKPENETPEVAPEPNEHHFFVTIITFYFFGLLLSFTPCVLPMIPILAGIIIGQKHLSTRKAFWLSFSYVLSMALTYALAGIGVAMLGKNFQAYLQKPALLLSFAALFVYLGLVQIGVLKAVFPNFSIKSWLAKFHYQQSGGTYISAAIMGILATLIASPCVSAPLIGALGYISHQGNIVLGGSALLALGFGMGTILLIMGTLGGRFLPKSGAWMHYVNLVFTYLMFGLAIWLFDRVYPGPGTFVLWGALCLFIAWTIKKPRIIRMLAIICALFLFWSAIQNTKTTSLSFQTVQSLSELQSAKIAGKPSLLVFYADWCTSCRKVEKALHSDEVQSQLKGWVLIKVDLTKFKQTDQELLKAFDLIGPPALIFFDKNGSELTSYKVVGGISAQELSQKLSNFNKMQE